MSMNNIYSPGSSSYVFSPFAGLHGCYPIPGLVQGSKPPPLTMLSPAGSKLARNTATVPPLNQVSPSNGLTSVSNNTALNATRTSGFAAALRKLAYQAKDPADEDIKHSSPNSTNSSPRSTTPKRAPPPLVYSSQSSTLTSPPVVTIAPTPSHQSAQDMRHGMDRIPSAHSTSSSYEPLALKQERDQRPLSRHSREDERINKDGQCLSHSARITPHSNPGAGLLPTSREESLARGFQPYRHGEEIRPPVPSGFGMDPAYAAYHSALLASHYSHSAYRFEDPLLLERYRMMQPSFMPFSHPGMMAHPGVHPLLAGSRYPPELLHQYPYISPSAAQGLDPRSPALSAERARLEEERQREIDREKEKDKEKEREKEKWREKEREKEAAQRMREHEMERERERIERLKLERLELERREYLAQNSGHDVAHRSEQHREDLSASKFGSITQGTPRDALFSDKYKQPHHSQRSLLESRHDNHHKTSTQLHESRNLTHHRESSRNSIPIDAHRRHEHNHRSESDHSRGHPPPLISPKEPGEIAQHRSDNGLFRPFEKESRSAYPHLEVPNLHNRKAELTVPSLKIPHREGHADIKHKSYSNERSQVHGAMHGSIAAHGSLSNHTKENYGLKKVVNDINKNSKVMTDEVSHDSVPNHVAIDKPKVHVPVSKLDKEEERLRKARLNGTYVSDDEDDDWSEKEEDRIERMMLIRSGPPLPMDKSPAKIKFLSGLGLYTTQKKKDKEFERFKKRRKLFREKSLSPIIVEEERKIGSPLTIPKIDPDLLCIESDYPTKCSFLSSFNLQQLERDKRKELCMIREACVLEKKRRLGIDDSQPQEETSSTTMKKEKGVKRKRGENSSHDVNTSEPVKLTLGQLQQRHLAAQQNKLNNIHNKVTDNRAVIFPESRSRGKILSREFAEQFHESVLQTTRQKELASRLGNTRSDEAPNQTTENTSSTHPRYHVTSDGIGASSLSDQSDSSFKWPGITAVMEAYQRHAEEQRTEREMLSDRCKKLQADNRDLNKAAEKLSNRMSSLLEKKQQYEDDRSRTQGAIENLKKSLRCLR